MKNRFIVAALCMLALAGAALLTGCQVTPEQSREQAYVKHMDRSRINDDWTWILGLDDPSILYNESLPPFH